MLRYLPHTEEEIKEMLETIGVDSIDELFQMIPERLRISSLDLGKPMDEYNLVNYFRNIGESNVSMDKLRVFRGAGIYNHFIPYVVYNLASRTEFLTAYTPYQPEVSQGTLTFMFEFQTMICELTGMEVANSSMYDGASAMAEAILMAARLKNRFKAYVAESVHPEYIQVAKTYCMGPGIELELMPFDETTGRVDLKDVDFTDGEKPAALVVGYPNFFGVIEDLRAIRTALPDDVLLIVVANPLALALYRAPGDLGADIVVGDGQPLGIPPQFGGPSFGFFATRMKYVRQMPGRIVGKARDLKGREGYVMILQTREQHIRRHRATSNICTNHAHSALMATVYMSLMGRKGLKEVAKRCHDGAHYLARELISSLGGKLVFNAPFFHEFLIRLEMDTKYMDEKLREKGFLGPLPIVDFYPRFGDDVALFCVTELNTIDEMNELVNILEAIKNGDI
ncbi:MAG: aminomethyl-transferring glycine dehydrogenase subunit GcvPA [Thermotogae bacterium]|nr:aminomethyl-transferring glycine dehydrogenase subunit GcvPA [Thermotogota bacterium]